ncbi:MAG TPA: ethylbenzene dehydrogenase-related protein [Anaerohalosphaeraceae bacterium]|nr:ethylbenzene dehydrogenase-related protein [Anaerohalosphaeraceae bacterium]
MKSRTLFVLCVAGAIVLLCGLSCRKKQAQAANAKPQPPTAQVAPESLVKPESPEKGVCIPRPIQQKNEFTDFVPPKRKPMDLTLQCRYVQTTVQTDGTANEPVWAGLPEITTLDFSSQRPIRLKAFHNGQSIFLLVVYPDSAASESHKSWFWDPTEQIYKPGNDQEDMLVLKWRLNGENLSLSPEQLVPHKADIWFWKACRTNPLGYLDDKQQEVTLEPQAESLALPSKQYGTLYLRRTGDEGQAAYTEKFFFDYQGNVLLRYYPQEPSGSRADIRGKGQWTEGQWTLEIQRVLQTGHEDDVQFEVGQTYLFAATVYEMAGTGIEPQWQQPLYRTGNAFDRLYLVIEPPQN